MASPVLAMASDAPSVGIHVAPARFLFEERAGGSDAASAIVAICASLALHLPFLFLLAAWLPESRQVVRERNVTALFDALVEEARIVPVDLAALAQGGAAAPTDGPAPGAVSLADAPASRGEVCQALPDRSYRKGPRPDAGEMSLSSPEHKDGGSESGGEDAPFLASRVAPPEDVLARSMKGSGKLSPEEAREQRARWFAWYRGLLSERFFAVYPRARLEKEGVRGTLTFKMELSPDGSLKSLTVTRADNPAMEQALREAVASVTKWPSYEATGLKFFPPFTFHINHGPGEWKTASVARSSHLPE